MRRWLYARITFLEVGHDFYLLIPLSRVGSLVTLYTRSIVLSLSLKDGTLDFVAKAFPLFLLMFSVKYLLSLTNETFDITGHPRLVFAMQFNSFKW